MAVLWLGCETKRGTEWEDPTVFQINQEKPRAHFFPYESEALAIENNPDRSQYFQSLNGEWKFNFSPNPNDREKNFYKANFDDSEWGGVISPTDERNNKLNEFIDAFLK